MTTQAEIEKRLEEARKSLEATAERARIARLKEIEQKRVTWTAEFRETLQTMLGLEIDPKDIEWVGDNQYPYMLYQLGEWTLGPRTSNYDVTRREFDVVKRCTCGEWLRKNVYFFRRNPHLPEETWRDLAIVDKAEWRDRTGNDYRPHTCSTRRFVAVNQHGATIELNAKDKQDAYVEALKRIGYEIRFEDR